MDPRNFLAIVFGGVLLYIVIRVFQSPVRWAVRVFINGALGLVALAIWNHLFVHHGWTIGLNPVTGATVGVLGAPGFLMLLAIKVLVL